MTIGHIQVKDYATLNGVKLYVHSVVTNSNGTYLKALTDKGSGFIHNELIKINEKDEIKFA